MRLRRCLEYDAQGNELFNIEKILDRRKSGRSHEYLIKWRGYDDTGNSWLLKKDAVGGGAKQMLRDFDLWYDAQTEESSDRQVEPIVHSHATRMAKRQSNISIPESSEETQ